MASIPEGQTATLELDLLWPHGPNREGRHLETLVPGRHLFSRVVDKTERIY